MPDRPIPKALTSVQAARYRRIVDSLESGAVGRTWVYQIINMVQFAALHYVATSEGRQLVVRTGDGHYGAFYAHAWLGWFPTLEDAIAAVTNR